MAVKRKLPVKRVEVQLTGDYEGWYFAYRQNPPMGLYLERMAALQALDQSDENSVLRATAGMYGVLELMLIDWNFVDENGDDIPATLEGLRALPMDLIQEMFSQMKGAVTEAPLASSAS